MKHINKLLIALVTVVLLASCGSEPSLQEYYVDSEEKDGFISTTIPKGILGMDTSTMSESSKKAYNSIDRVNVLYYPIDKNNPAIFEKEAAQLSTILKNDDYKALMTHKSDDMRIKVLYEGDPKDIDEVVVYASSPQMGLGVARILGDDMELGAIMKMMEELKDAKPNKSGIISILKDFGVDESDLNDSDFKIDSLDI